jgi:dipeptidyl aminopeptidase/acylaminoacyl peptidase
MTDKNTSCTSPIHTYTLLAILVGVVALILVSPSLAQTNNAVFKPGDNLVVEGIPPIPLPIAEQANRYTEVREAGFFDWHPTQRDMLIGTRFGDTQQVHEVKAPGGARTQLTFFPDRVMGALFEPVSGKYFVFDKDVGGGEWFQYYRYDMATGDITLLTDGKSRNLGAKLSHSGDHMVYTSTRRTGKDTDVWIMNPADPKSDRMLLQLEGGGWQPEDWSADDKTILLREAISVNESYLWRVEEGHKALITPKGGERVVHDNARFGKDGKGIYVITDKDSEFRRLAYLDLATMKYTFLTSTLSWDVEDFELSEDGRSIAYTVNQDGSSALHVMDTASRKERPTSKLPSGVITALKWHKNNRDLGFSLSWAHAPRDAYSVDTTTGQLSRWTASETGGLNADSFATPQLIRWKSFDGRQISGLLYKPGPKFSGKRPVMVVIHGGPEGQSRPNFLGRENYYVNELGIVLIFPNVRGSTGYGKSFLDLDNGMLRENTYKDIGVLLDWIKSQPELDGQHIMVTGGSYGGHMTYAVATNYNDQICCSLPVVGITNLVSLLEHTESYRRDLRRVEYGDEREPRMREYLTRIAPLTNADKITKPLFAVVGKNDPRVPYGESVQILEKLRKNGTPTWFLIANDEGHGYAKKKNRDFQFYSTIMFVRQYLLHESNANLAKQSQ